MTPAAPCPKPLRSSSSGLSVAAAPAHRLAGDEFAVVLRDLKPFTLGDLEQRLAAVTLACGPVGDCLALGLLRQSLTAKI
jgi:hypothetical protein